MGYGLFGLRVVQLSILGAFFIHRVSIDCTQEVLVINIISRTLSPLLLFVFPSSDFLLFVLPSSLCFPGTRSLRNMNCLPLIIFQMSGGFAGLAEAVLIMCSMFFLCVQVVLTQNLSIITLLRFSRM